ncbi:MULTISPECIES: YagK/YfjJ domain-containing protein [unclassified Pseudomonas]|uniref:YagK/YfjJ domain-containing protein n=1 Tax=unclassified Pseudomonas TaxID=196821 RepID=UPI002B235053|nr:MULTISPECIES: inovirus-type Gp2 protein [unclassified Pseudomonas]MEA9978579.1 inovirus-type Gp2 protein [Pseudomonas sp. RTS4]MEB0196888.1 inovirus-type Gp2 protein [Pseudomonas sp. 5S4]MEB0245833.1 inovirus-type Gp2 protein [Pseudomonas sp. 10S5]
MDEYDELCAVMRGKCVESIFDGEQDGCHQEFDGENMFFGGITKVVAAIRVIQETKGKALLTAKYQKSNLVTSKRGRVVVSAMRESILEYEWAKTNYKLSPYIDKFYECRQAFPYGICSDSLMVDEDESLRQMNAFAMGVYEAITSKEFKKAERDHARAANKLYVSFESYIDDLIGVCARLLVVRIDLSYKRFELEVDEFDCVYNKTDEQKNSDCVFKHRDQLLKILSKSNSPYAMVGYAWKLEYGKRRGFHYHFMLFLDGSKVMRHIAIGKAIGEMWANEITGGLGSYWNCTGKELYYKTCGVGEIDHYDTAKILAVKDAAAYLVKIDRWIAVCLPRGKRCFGKGVVKKVEGKKPGRPRVKGIQATPLSQCSGQIFAVEQFSKYAI